MQFTDFFLKEREQCSENERILICSYRGSFRKSRCFLLHFQIPKRAIVQFISKLTYKGSQKVYINHRDLLKVLSIKNFKCGMCFVR